jgi:hypothetical protein
MSIEQDQGPGTYPALRSPVHTNAYGIRALIAAEAIFYFSALASHEAGLVTAYRLVKGVLGPHLTWYDTEALRGPRPLKPKDLDAFEVWFGPGAVPREEYELVLGSGAGVGEIGPWGLRFEVERYALPGTLGYFKIALPADQVLADPGTFRDLTHRLFDALPWVHGHAGLGILFDPGDIDPRRDAAVRAHCMRYLGLDCSDVLTETEALGAAVKGADWLSFLGPELAQRLDLSTLPSGVTAERRIDGRIVIQAGPAPRLGDSNRREDMSSYRAVNRVLRPIRVPRLFPLPGFADEDDTARWLERFDVEPDEAEP